MISLRSSIRNSTFALLRFTRSQFALLFSRSCILLLTNEIKESKTMNVEVGKTEVRFSNVECRIDPSPSHIRHSGFQTGLESVSASESIFFKTGSTYRMSGPKTDEFEYLPAPACACLQEINEFPGVTGQPRKSSDDFIVLAYNGVIWQGYSSEPFAFQPAVFFMLLP